MKNLKRYALKLIDTYLPISSTAWPQKRFAICYFFIVMPPLLWFNRWILAFSFISVTTVVELERARSKFHLGISSCGCYILDVLWGQLIKLVQVFFYFRITWILIEQCCFYSFAPLHFVQCFRSLKHWHVQKLRMKTFDQNSSFLLKNRNFGALTFQEREFFDHFKYNFMTPKNLDFLNLIWYNNHP